MDNNSRTNSHDAIYDMSIPRLFLHLRAERKTGVAIFEKDGITKKVYFKDGDAVFAVSNQENDRLGRRLLVAGRLEQNQYHAISEIVQKTGKLEGSVMVELGFVSRDELEDAFRRQARDIILSLFSWRKGSHRFEETAVPLAGITPIGMSVGNIIREGLTGFEWQAVRRSLPPLVTILRPAENPAALLQAAGLSEDQKSVLLLIDGEKSIEQICAASKIGDFNTLTAIHLFLALGIIEVGDIKEGDARTQAQQAVRLAIGIEEAYAGPEFHEASPEEVRRAVQSAFEEMEGRDLYQVLGVAEDASLRDIRRAYFRLAKLYHPDRHFDPQLSDMKGPLEAIFSRLTEAYNTLSSPSLRAEYDIRRAAGAQKIEPEEDKTDRKASAAGQFNKGYKEFKAGNFWGASEAFRWASRLDPTNSRYFYYLGLSLAQMPRRGHDAEESFKKAIELEPTRSEYYIELGNLYLSNNMKTRAVSLYREALRWDPDSEMLKQALKAVEKG